VAKSITAFCVGLLMSLIAAGLVTCFGNRAVNDQGRAWIALSPPSNWLARWMVALSYRAILADLGRLAPATLPGRAGARS